MLNNDCIQENENQLCVNANLFFANFRIDR